VAPKHNSNFDLWGGKLGKNSGETRILKLLVERPTQGFTRKQLAVAIGASYSSVKSVYVPKLKKLLLVKEEGEKIKASSEILA
jgi:hypothetical protein